jgi:dienelactone hydrolase family protein
MGRCPASRVGGGRRFCSRSAGEVGSTSLDRGADLKGVVSFHGGLSTKAPGKVGSVKAGILCCTGADDPMIPADQVVAFEEEMGAASVRSPSAFAIERFDAGHERSPLRNAGEAAACASLACDLIDRRAVHIAGGLQSAQPSTTNDRKVDDLSRIAASSLCSGASCQALTFAMLSNT